MLFYLNNTPSDYVHICPYLSYPRGILIFTGFVKLINLDTCTQTMYLFSARIVGTFIAHNGLQFDLKQRIKNETHT